MSPPTAAETAASFGAAGDGRGKRAVITGITGQDGSFLGELLLEKGYEVTGVVRRDPAAPLGSSEHLRERIEVVHVDLLDGAAVRELLAARRPHELYHLASPTFVPQTWQEPAQTLAAIVGSSATILESVRDLDPTIRVFVASSTAMFGDAPETPQNEDTPCRPQNVYGVAKLAAHQLLGLMRERDGLYACSGICNNHESERRPEQFVTRKITRGAVEIKLGRAQELWLGDLGAVRDWSFAGDIVRAAWLSLQQEQGRDYMLASGVGHTVREFAEAAFARVGLEAEPHLRQDPELVRGPEPTLYIGDPSRARAELGWEPTLSFEQLVERMVDFDMRELAAEDERPARPTSGAAG
jgi:GDPmannose 4,6-dehydratase